METERIVTVKDKGTHHVSVTTMSASFSASSGEFVNVIKLAVPASSLLVSISSFIDKLDNAQIKAPGGKADSPHDV
jgi:hypothetical protein